MLLTLIVCLTTCCSSGAADISGPDEPGKEDKTTCIIVTKATKTARMTGQPVPGETIPSPNNTPVNYNTRGIACPTDYHLGGFVMEITPVKDI